MYIICYSQSGFYNPGEICWWNGLIPPPGYLACDGSDVQQAVYPALFAAINHTHGPAYIMRPHRFPWLRRLLRLPTDYLAPNPDAPASGYFRLPKIEDKNDVTR